MCEVATGLPALHLHSVLFMDFVGTNAGLQEPELLQHIFLLLFFFFFFKPDLNLSGFLALKRQKKGLLPGVEWKGKTEVQIQAIFSTTLFYFTFI